MVLPVGAGSLRGMSAAGALRGGAPPWTPKRLRPRLWLDAWYESWRRGLSAPVLVDGFNRANGSLGSAPTGQAYSVVSGTWSIASGTARCDNTDFAHAKFGATLADGRMSMRTRTTNTAAVGQLMFRYVDSSNYLLARRGLSGVIIGKVDGGVSSALAIAGTGLAANVWDVLEVRFSGNQIDLYLNGTLTTSYTLAGADAAKYSNANTGIGLQRSGSSAATVEYDDITVSSGASSALLDTWADSSGNGFDFSQATATKQPLLTWSVSASGILVPVVRFDGVDDLLVRSAVDVSTAQQGHVHVSLARSVSALSVLFGSAQTAVGTRFLYFESQGTTGVSRITQRNNDTTDNIDGPSITANTPAIIDWNSDGSAYHQWVNGAATSLTATGGANNGDWFGDVSFADNFSVGAAKQSSEGGFAATDMHSIVVTDAVIGGQLLPLDRFNSNRYGMGISL